MKKEIKSETIFLIFGLFAFMIAGVCVTPMLVSQHKKKVQDERLMEEITQAIKDEDFITAELKIQQLNGEDGLINESRNKAKKEALLKIVEEAKQNSQKEKGKN